MVPSKRVVVVAAEDGGGHVDLADGVLQVAPDAFIPVVVGKVRMIDPVGVALYRVPQRSVSTLIWGRY